MHLKQLKLAGFKSFVEPTVVPFSSQLVAVVGPNGCGKSNIIDAVRWVMGESSAKNLRGESMTDVIFNGSSHRKSVGQASVELVFDNSMGRLTGQYASYQEIAVKRVVTREGDSHYYLNGSRCRRRDITDIFLGTGAGARGYSIIGQDTISRLIEARPEDLRAYLEEAAGVSKYKERRRETLQRIAHTRENLARVTDIRDELDKQLQRLERQANAAIRYKSLKQEERLCKAEILALKWRALTMEQAHVHRELTQLTLQHEQHRAKVVSCDKENITLRENLHVAQEDFQQTQVSFYQLSTEIARLEESIQQQQREKQRLAEDKAQLQTDIQTEIEQLQQDTEALNTCEQSLILLQTNLQTLQAEFTEHQQAFSEKQQQKISWDNQWQAVQSVYNQAQQDFQVAEVHRQHLEQRYQQTMLRLEKVQQEQTMIVSESLQAELIQLQTKLLALTAQHQEDGERQERVTSQGILIRQQLISIEQALNQGHDKVRALITEQAALLATQNAILRNTNEKTTHLSQWAHASRVAEVIQVADEWLQACELVLGEGLQAIVLDSMDVLWAELASLHGCPVLFVEQAQTQNGTTSYPRLSDKITGGMPHWLHALDQVFTANNLEEAMKWLPTLTKEQSVVTPDGYWIGQGWVKIAGAITNDDPGLLSRKQALATLNKTLTIEQDHVSTLQENRDQLRALLVENERENDESKQILASSNDALRRCQADIHNKQQSLEHAITRESALTEERESLQFDLEDIATQKIAIASKGQEASAAVLQHEQRLQQLMTEKSCWEEALKMAQTAIGEKQAVLQQMELQSHKETLKAQQLRDGIQRKQNQISTLQERLAVLVARWDELAMPDSELSALLHEKLKQHQQWEEALAKQRQVTDELQHQLNENERISKQEDHQASVVQEKIQKEQLQEQTLAVRADGIVESLAELSANVDVLLSDLAAEITIESREQTLISLDEKIKRLGAINLVAIEEHQTELERKNHLDAQYQDLMSALTTLDAAIAKMDKETQLRLKDTFDQVNSSFQSLFPRLFGGGRAQLELTCDNLLEAGILVMAQPPGKRNSTIHLLSGGEKAMTAVALVFAIFELNPSPFCMLDEVDAPLDDLNVRRFCDLVKEMSPFVQFLFITHNKVTMELADHLIGVTMREPGVSRVVAVDVEEALAIAE